MIHLLLVLMLVFAATAAGTAAGIVAAALLLRRYLRRRLGALPWRNLQLRGQHALATWQHTRRRARIAYLERWNRQWEQAHR